MNRACIARPSGVLTAHHTRRARDTASASGPFPRSRPRWHSPPLPPVTNTHLGSRLPFHLLRLLTLRPSYACVFRLTTSCPRCCASGSTCLAGAVGAAPPTRPASRSSSPGRRGCGFGSGAFCPVRRGVSSVAGCFGSSALSTRWSVAWGACGVGLGMRYGSS